MTITSQNKYFRRLCDYVGCGNPEDSRQRVLLLLYEMDFYSLIPNDDNRLADGLKVRLMFPEDTEDLLEKNCSVLEMLIGLANHVAFNQFDPRTSDNFEIEYWFWRMLSNLKLHPDTVFENINVVNGFLKRTYSYNGVGGLFPVRHPPGDMRKIELWYQMNHWLEEIEE